MVKPELPSPAIKKRKPLIFEANLCSDRQWDDYQEAVCPLLGEFGCFDDSHD